MRSQESTTLTIGPFPCPFFLTPYFILKEEV
jgi:hypothetical protein